MKISACLITKNEEQNIALCINSFKDFVDEIIVVDTGSTDNTVKIAKKLGARVYYYKWNNNFSDARNYAIKQAKGNWIIFLDADEYFYGGTGSNIRNVLREIHNNREVDALLCKCFDIDDQGQFITNGDTRTRIFRNDKRLRYVGPIHEYIKASDDKLGLVTVPEDELIIYHSGYSTREVLEKKERRNFALLLNELNSGRATPPMYAYLALSYYNFKDYENAIEHARKFLDSGYTLLGKNVQLRRILITCMMAAGVEPEQIYSEISLALAEFSDHPDIQWMLGQHLFEVKKYSLALDAFDKALKLAVVYDGLELVELPISEISYKIGVLYELKNDLRKAEDYLVRSLQVNKWNGEALAKLIKITDKRTTQENIRVLNSLYDVTSHEDIRFLLSILASLRSGMLLSRYYQIWNRRFGQEDLSLLFVLLTENKYDEAFGYFMESYLMGTSEWAATLAVVCSLLGNNPKNIDEIRKYVNPALKRIIDCYCTDDENIVFLKEDLAFYISLLNEFVYLKAEEHIRCLLKLSNRFEVNLSSAIGDCLANSGEYEQAVEKFREALASHPSDAADLYFKIGFCYYKSLKYDEAKKFMEIAMSHGYSNNDIHEFLKWMSSET